MAKGDSIVMSAQCVWRGRTGIANPTHENEACQAHRCTAPQYTQSDLEVVVEEFFTCFRRDGEWGVFGSRKQRKPLH